MNEILTKEIPFNVICVNVDNEVARFFSTKRPNVLFKGKTYTVIGREVRDWHTKLQLEGLEGKFNSVHFEVEP